MTTQREIINRMQNQIDELRELVDMQKGVLKDCYDFILSEYSDTKAQALEGEVISKEARPIWNKLCIILSES